MQIWFVWETNAWKSTLFNKFFWSFRAIVSDIPWTTRENIKEYITWNTENNTGKNNAIIIDSPGLDNFSKERYYIKKIIDESDIIILVVDWKWSLTENINKITNYIRKTWKKEKTILAVNKIDTTNISQINLFLADWYILWFENIIPISAKHNYNLVDLKEKIEELRKKFDISLVENKSNNINITFVWKINVWKSTLFNSIIWKNFSKISPEWWTTLDYLTYPIKIWNTKFEIIDTAWFRRKWKIHWLEKIAVKDKFSTLLSIKKPVIVVLFDISEWIKHIDMTVLWDMLKRNLPLVVALNKIDAIDKDQLNIYKKELKNWMRFAPWIPIVMISWKEKKWLKKLFDMIKLVYKNWKIKISTSELNNLVHNSFIKNPPKFSKNKIVKIKYIVQDKNNTNRFIVFVNNSSKINFSFKKWLENIIRKKYWFFWIPLNFEFRDENEK